MDKETRWQVWDTSCPEEACPGSKLLLEWQKEQGKWVLSGVSCDNPRLKETDNWECRWGCWEKAAKLAQDSANQA